MFDVLHGLDARHGVRREPGVRGGDAYRARRRRARVRVRPPQRHHLAGEQTPRHIFTPLATPLYSHLYSHHTAFTSLFTGESYSAAQFADRTKDFVASTRREARQLQRQGDGAEGGGAEGGAAAEPAAEEKPAE